MGCYKKQFIFLFLPLIIAIHASDIDREREMDKDKHSLSTTVCGTLQIPSACITNLLSQSIEAQKIAIAFGCANVFRVDDFCAQNARTNNLCTNNFQTANICASSVDSLWVSTNYVTTQTICANSFQVVNGCADTLTVNDLIITSTFGLCSFYGASVGLSANTTYTLGTDLPYNSIEADPSGSISLNPLTYTAPQTGNYIISAQVVSQNLAGTSIIAGTPIARIQILSNNGVRSQVDLPYLTFNTGQASLSTTLITLTQGDVVTVTYEVYVLDPAIGFTPYTGQVNLVGGIAGSFRSFFQVEYLSSNCSPSTQCVITPCGPSQITCNFQPCTPCEPCTLQPCPCPPCF
jgi:hypothetical protein